MPNTPNMPITPVTPNTPIASHSPITPIAPIASHSPITPTAPVVTLSVIIPYYTETPRDIFPLLASLNGQVGVDFSQIQVILVNDGSQNQFPASFLALFQNLRLQSLYLPENRGAGVARQAGIDVALGEYVMFCDADDTLHNVGVLRIFLQVMAAQHPDMLGSPWYEERHNPDTGALVYVPCDNDHTWLHGKAFNRAFLTAKNIRFHEELRVCEDCYFLTLVAAEAETARRVSVISYVWKWNPRSTTRAAGDLFRFAQAPQRIRTLPYAFDVIEKKHPEKMPLMVTDAIMLYFFLLNQAEWQHPENSSHLLEAETALREVMERYRQYYEQAPGPLVAQVYNQHRAIHLAANGERETAVLGSWYKRIMQSCSSE